MGEVAIERAGVDSLDRLAPLWESLRRHHAAVEPDLDYIDPEQSWQLRRRLYLDILGHDGSFALIARLDGADVGYAVVALHDGPDDTWVTGARLAEVETLSVVPAVRGRGVGSALLDRVDVELAAIGVHDLAIAVVADNTSAVEFYERRGLRRRLVVFSNLGTPARGLATP
jgi:GNAT superfamily N-acetyltransferase